MTGGPPAGGDADSAGTPWAQRDLQPSGFETDTGAADPALLAVLATDDDEALVRAVARARFVVPVVATAASVEEVGDHTVDTGVDMAAVTLTAPDGRRALPVFTGTEALAAWDPAARPVPVTAARAAQAAVSEGCDVIVLDVAGPTSRELRPSMVWALAQQRDWLPAHTDPFVAGAVATACARVPQVRGHRVEEGEPVGSGTLAVVLELAPGLDADEVRGVATAVGERLATDGELRARVDALAFRLV